MKKVTSLPNHVAIVPDGNGRWAQQRGLPRLEGHRAGAENMWTIVKYLNEYPIKCVTLYGFSTENWSRPEDEVSGLFQILEGFIKNKTSEIHKRGIRLRHIGCMEALPQWLQRAINEAVELTRENMRVVLTLAFNYGGRAEIINAVRCLIADGILTEKVDEKLFAKYLYTVGLPDVDLLIRTSNELRLSNFLIWQSAYSEFYSTDVLWPDFGKEDIDEALRAYSQRQRRFGGL